MGGRRKREKTERAKQGDAPEKADQGETADNEAVGKLRKSGNPKGQCGKREREKIRKKRRKSEKTAAGVR